MTTDSTTTRSNTTADAQRCPGCGALNDCAIARGEQQCWCMVEPIGISLPTSSSQSCYCSDCLRTMSASSENTSAAKNQTKG